MKCKCVSLKSTCVCVCVCVSGKTEGWKKYLKFRLWVTKSRRLPGYDGSQNSHLFSEWLFVHSEFDVRGLRHYLFHLQLWPVKKLFNVNQVIRVPVCASDDKSSAVSPLPGDKRTLLANLAFIQDVHVYYPYHTVKWLARGFDSQQVCGCFSSPPPTTEPRSVLRVASSVCLARP
jgi:hypothetical protein